MKKDFTYLAHWLGTLAVATTAWVWWGLGFVSLVGAFLISDGTAQTVFSYLIGTAVICASLALTSYRVSLKINGKSMPVSLRVPLLNLLTGTVIAVSVFAVFKGSFVVDPQTNLLAIALWDHETDPDWNFIKKERFPGMVFLCILQTLLYAAVSFFFYVRAKIKQETKNEIVSKLREERENPTDHK